MQESVHSEDLESRLELRDKEIYELRVLVAALKIKVVKLEQKVEDNHKFCWHGYNVIRDYITGIVNWLRTLPGAPRFPVMDGILVF